MTNPIPDALIAAFERHYGCSWNDPALGKERLAWRAAWAEATKPCLHQIQEPAPSMSMYANKADYEAATQAAPAAVAVPELQDVLRELRAQIHQITVQLPPSVDCSGVWMAHDKMSAALAATPAAAPAEGFELWWEDHKPSATQAEAWSAWVALHNDSSAAAQVVLPEQALRATGIEQVARMLQKRADDYADEHLSTDPDTGTTEGSEAHIEYWNWLLELADDVRALLAGVSAPAAHCSTCDDHGAVGNIPTAEPCPDCTVPAIRAQADARDAARYRYLRDGDWREQESLEPVIRLQFNTKWDEKIDAAIAAQAAQQGGAA